MKEGAFYYINKPVDLEELMVILKKASETHSLLAENRYFKDQLEEKFKDITIVGESKPVKEVLSVIDKFNIKGIAHLTGGAYYEKLTKILPAGKCFEIKRGSWSVPKVFEIIQKKGRISDSEMYRTFNMGIGLAIVAGGNQAKKLKRFLSGRKIKYYEIGKVVVDSKRKIKFKP